MDFIELVILLIIFLAPAIGRLFGKKQPPAPPRPAEPGGEDAPPTQQIETDPISEALRQIREALAEGSAEPVRTEPDPAFATTGSTAPKRKEPKRKDPPKRKEPKRKDLTKRIDLAERVDLAKPPEVAKPAPAFSARTFTRRLRDPQRAREAFILHEVFGPPRSRRRR